VFAAHEIAMLIGGLDGVRELTVIESGIALRNPLIFDRTHDRLN